MHSGKNYVLPVIVIAQLFCTSLWFAGNAVMQDLMTRLNLPSNYLAQLTSAVQFGFIAGTFIFAVFTIADRFSPSKVFFASAIIAAGVNMLSVMNFTDSNILLFSRFATGFFLAGVYPVGMKIISDYYQSGLGTGLGYLVGALVIGTASSHLLRSVTGEYSWQYVIYSTSVLSIIGGFSILFFVSDGPLRKAAEKFNLKAFIAGFQNKEFRSVATGYFGHMWELYTFWAFVPSMILMSQTKHVDLLAFLIIGIGGPACVAAGYISRKYGAKKVAIIALLLSAICCLVSPLLLQNNIFISAAFLFFWGIVVIADSPMFSTLIAQHAPSVSRASSLTIVNCIGFAITIISIQAIDLASKSIPQKNLMMLLAIGPVIGLIALTKKTKQ